MSEKICLVLFGFEIIKVIFDFKGRPLGSKTDSSIQWRTSFENLTFIYIKQLSISSSTFLHCSLTPQAPRPLIFNIRRPHFASKLIFVTKSVHLTLQFPAISFSPHHHLLSTRNIPKNVESSELKLLRCLATHKTEIYFILTFIF